MGNDELVEDDEPVAFDPAVSYRFPRLSEWYDLAIRGDSSVEKAKAMANYIFNMRLSSSEPLDKLLSVDRVSSFFEATIHYLHPRHENKLTEHEKSRLNGNKSKIFIADFAENSFDAVYSVLSGRNYYSVGYCRSASRLVESIHNELPDLFVVNDKSRNFDDRGILKCIRDAGFDTPAVVYGDLNYNEASKKYIRISNLLYFLHVPLEHQLLEYVELALNCIKPKKYNSFFIP